MLDSVFFVVYFCLDVVGLLSNVTALLYIFQSFNIKTHVFTLIFLDALISTACVIISSITDLLLITNIVLFQNFVCTILFLVSFLPCIYGALLTLIIAIVRLELAKKSAKNIHPSNKRVLCISLGVFTLIAIAILVYFLIHSMLNIPFALFADACLNPDIESRSFSIHGLVLQLPTLFNILSLITDVRMIRFLKKVIIPLNNQSNGVNLLVEKIPIRATIISALFVVPYVTLFAFVFRVDQSRKSVGLQSRIILLTTLAIRCPMTAVLAFKKVNGPNQQIVRVAKLQNAKRRNEVEMPVFSIT